MMPLLKSTRSYGHSGKSSFDKNRFLETPRNWFLFGSHSRYPNRIGYQISHQNQFSELSENLVWGKLSQGGSSKDPKLSNTPLFAQSFWPKFENVTGPNYSNRCRIQRLVLSFVLPNHLQRARVPPSSSSHLYWTQSMSWRWTCLVKIYTYNIYL